MASADRLIEVFNEAKARSPSDRGEFLTEACRDDAELKEQVHSLLQAYEGAGGFMHSSPQLSPEIEAELARLKPEAVGERIGPYRLMEQIGQGGFGTVWVADQERPVRRRVALKIIKLGMDTKEVIARFEQERQALAMMDHPNIAKVLDAGATEWGRPYFVMELVRGIKITDYCDQANLPTADRLALFTQVCSAVQHAHQNGIIHRDLKPSNILVTLHDGVPVPKVIDFGVAKATQQQRLTDRTIYTQFQQMIGTPLYMSPEQAEMSGLDVDTRSDIYSLGVLLYELLTGRTPFDPDELMKAGYDEIRRVIREQEPQTPSMFLKTMADETRATVAEHRQVDPAKLTNQLRGDLDWIVMKALEKNRTRRYETAKAFAEDLGRHLTNQPILARPPSRAYLFKKSVLRNKTACVTSAIAGVAMVAALLIGMQISRMSTTGNSNFSSANLSANTVKPAPRPLRPVSGVVLAEETGLPLSDALVRVAAPSRDMRDVLRGSPGVYEGRTDREGRFRIQVPQAETLSLDVLSPGYQAASGTMMSGSHLRLYDLPFAADPKLEFSIKLGRAVFVSGVVVDEDGRPFSDVVVEATLNGANYLAYIKFDKTDAAGRFEIFDFPLERRDNAKGRLRFEHPAMLRSAINDVYALDENARKSLRVTMHRGHDIKGSVTSSGGRPAVNTLIEALPSQPDAQFKQRYTDAEGRFVLKGLPDGEIVVRVHSLELEQKSQVTVRMAGADVDVNLQLEPVVMKNPLSLVTLLGMTLADITPELKAAYDLSDRATGVLIVNPGENIQRLGIGTPQEGEYFWVVGEKRITNLREMVEEMLRINELDPPTKGWTQEGYRGSIRIVYSNRHRSNTQHLKLTRDDAEELKKLLPTLREQDAK